jgi:uncharacterized protein YlxW (UPF0749 family)
MANLLVIAALLSILSGCGSDREDDQAERAERQRLQERLEEAQEQAAKAQQARKQLEKQLAKERQTADRNEQADEARVRHQQLDVRVAIIVWAATAVTCIVLGLLLAREHRLRRMLQRLLRELMGQDPYQYRKGNSS